MSILLNSKCDYRNSKQTQNRKYKIESGLKIQNVTVSIKTTGIIGLMLKVSGNRFAVNYLFRADSKFKTTARVENGFFVLKIRVLNSLFCFRFRISCFGF